MIEIFLLLSLLPGVMAAKRKRRRYNPNFFAIKFNINFTIGALADNTVAKTDWFATALENAARFISMDCVVTMTGHTAAEGPIQWGVMNGLLTAAEALEALDAEVLGPGWSQAREHSNRPVRLFGSFPGLSSDEVQNNGNQKRYKLRGLQIRDGDDLELFAVNRSGATLTTGTQITVSGTIYGVWT